MMNLVSLEKEIRICTYHIHQHQRVGDVVLEGFKKYTHKARLWSLDKAQSLEEIIDWHNRNVKFVKEMRC